MDDITLNLAAARIIGKVVLRVTGKGVLTTAGSVFRPATDIADSMRVVEAMRAKGWLLTVYDNGKEYVAHLTSGVRKEYARDASLPRALALAAVRAVEQENP